MPRGGEGREEKGNEGLTVSNYLLYVLHVLSLKGWNRLESKRQKAHVRCQLKKGATLFGFVDTGKFVFTTKSLFYDMLGL